MFGDSGYLDRNLLGEVLEAKTRSWALSIDGMVALRADVASDFTAAGTFSVLLDGVSFDITLANTGDNTALADLVADLNDAIDSNISLEPVLLARIESGYLVLEGATDKGIYTIEVTDSPLVQSLGFVQRQMASVDYPNLGGDDAIDFAVGNKGAEVIMAATATT